jgi:hypothetical protein
MPPRLSCALGAAEVQGSQNLDLVYTQINERDFLFCTVRPIRRGNKGAGEPARGRREHAPTGELARDAGHRAAPDSPA